MATETKATHTPRPWTVAHYPNSRQSRVIAPGGVEFLETAILGISTETWNANLQLIAASPDLLDLVRRMHERLTDGRDLPGWAEAWAEEIEAAIAKAEGR